MNHFRGRFRKRNSYGAKKSELACVSFEGMYGVRRSVVSTFFKRGPLRTIQIIYVSNCSILTMNDASIQ